MSRVIVIIPAYNEALNLDRVIKDVKENCPYDYVIINDCSKDNTLELCQQKKWNYLSLPVNYGLTSVVQLGMKYAKEYDYDIAIQFDGDGQHDAKYLKDLVDQIEKGQDVVIGSRFVKAKKNHSARMLGNSLISGLIKLTTGKTIKDPTSGMRAYGAKSINDFVYNDSLSPEPDTMVFFLKRGYKIKEIQVKMREREFGQSYLTLTKSIGYMAKILFSIIFVRNFTRKEKKQ